MKHNFDFSSSSFFLIVCATTALLSTFDQRSSSSSNIGVNAWTPPSTSNTGNAFTYGNIATQATATAAPPFSHPTTTTTTTSNHQQTPSYQDQQQQVQQNYAGQEQYQQQYQEQQQQQQQQQPQVTNLVETRKDPFGGTGLYATTSIRQGEAFYVLPENDIVFSPPDNTPISDCVNSFCVNGNGIFDSISIGASLATWRLFQNNPNLRHHTTGNIHTMRQAGISEASQGHAENLPWDKARWQLPLLWPEEVLDQALSYGVDQAFQQEYEQSLKEFSTSTSTTQQIQKACEEAKNRVNNFQTAAARLAEELGPSLQKEYGIHATEEEISLACHQAMGLVFSRTFIHPPSGEMTMLPTIDSANHHADPNAIVKNNFETASTTNSAGSMLVAQHDIKEGEEITISYGLEESGNVLSFSGYGFVPQGMAQESAAGRALQVAAQKGQEIAKERLEQEEKNNGNF